MKNKMNDYTQKCNHPEIRELTLANGIAYPSDEELVMLILGKGTKDNPIEQLSEKVIQAINASNEDNLVENLTAIDGMGSSRALAISAAIELGRRRKQPYEIRTLHHHNHKRCPRNHRIKSNFHRNSQPGIDPSKRSFCGRSFPACIWNHMLSQPSMQPVLPKQCRHRIHKAAVQSLIDSWYLISRSYNHNP